METQNIGNLLNNTDNENMQQKNGMLLRVNQKVIIQKLIQ